MATTTTLRHAVLEMAGKSGLSESDIDLLKPSILKQREAFAVLLFRKNGAMGVSPEVRKKLSDSLDAIRIQMLAIDVVENPDACASLGVASSTPKLVFFNRRTNTVTPPAWLVDPDRDEQDSTMEAWITGLSGGPQASQKPVDAIKSLQLGQAATTQDLLECAEGSS